MLGKRKPKTAVGIPFSKYDVPKRKKKRGKK